MISQYKEKLLLLFYKPPNIVPKHDRDKSGERIAEYDHVVYEPRRLLRALSKIEKNRKI